MEMMPVKPERKAQLEEYARRRGQDAATALDEVLADFLEQEQLEFQQSVEAIQRGYNDVLAGRTRPAAEVFEELRVKHGLPR
jgi:predicted transcriptional regulator